MISLVNTTTNSISYGVRRPKHWVKVAAAKGYKALGITEKQSLASWVEFHEANEKLEEPMKLLYGTQVILVENVYDKEAPYIAELTLFAMNDKGAKNLIKLNNFSHRRPKIKEKTGEVVKEGGFFFRPRVDYRKLRECSEGVYCLVPTHWLNDDLNPKVEERFYEQIENIFVKNLSFAVDDKENNLSLGPAHHEVRTFNARVPDSMETTLLDVVPRFENKQSMCIHKYSSIGYLPDKEEYEALTASMMCGDLQHIVDKCNYTLREREVLMPPLEIQHGSAKEDLLRWIGDGFKKYLCQDASFDFLRDLDDLAPYRSHASPEYNTGRGHRRSIGDLGLYIDRLRYEFEILEKLGFLDYFHVITTLCAVVDRAGFHRGYARGSAGASLILYLLGVTKFDPVYFDCPFERFINEDRNDLPDVDLDFSKSAREWVRNYLKDRYGDGYVCFIGAYGRIRISSGVQKIVAAYNYSAYNDNSQIIQYDKSRIDAITATKVKATARGDEELELMIEASPLFKQFAETHSDWVKDVLMPLQDGITHITKTASGMLISPIPLDDIIPIYEKEDKDSGKYVEISQWQGPEVERWLPKFDVLTVNALDVVERCFELIEQSGGEVPNMRNLDLDDPKVWAALAKGETDGSFQLNTRINKSYSRHFKPKSIFDISTQLAVNRSGPMEAGVPELVVARKFGEKEIIYEDPALEEILEESYGLMVFQEQMMAITKKVSLFTGSEADKVRKACGKKKKELMLPWEERFIQGGLDNGFPEDFLKSYWEKIVFFSEYSFNKAHSVAYALLAYLTIYLAVNYPREFWAAHMKFAETDKKKHNNIFRLKEVVEDKGIEVVWPKMAHFAPEFEPGKGNRIIWPIRAIKGFGVSSAERLCAGGRRSYDSVGEMIDNGLTFKTSLNLAAVGFFDTYGEPWEVVQMLREEFREADYLKRMSEAKNPSRIKPKSLDHKAFELPVKFRSDEEFQWVKLQNEMFGTRVRPWKSYDIFHENIEYYPGSTINDLDSEERVLIGGQVERLEVRTTKKGSRYAVCKLTDHNESIRLRFWGGFWEDIELDKQRIRPKEGDIIEVIGKINIWYPEKNKKIVTVDVSNSNNYYRLLWR